MSGEEMVSLVCCDLGAIVRGRSVLADELETVIGEGLGWAPANLALTPLGPVAEPNPFGSTGDVRLLPDPTTRARIDGHDGAPALELMLCDIVESDGAPWGCCPRTFLRETLAALEAEVGARASAGFEHEFQLLGETPGELPFSLAAQRRAEPFATAVVNALLDAGTEPQRFFAEYAERQFEIPVAASGAMAAADRAVVFREVVRDVARAHGMHASFVPLSDPGGAGNGVHIHLSLAGRDGAPLLFDPSRPAALSELGGSFAAGILRRAGALSSLSAPSPVSGARLRPHRWSAGAACLAPQNREALLRIPPLVTLGGAEAGGQMRLEYRGADAAANPHLALGALLRAGLEGIREGLAPPPLLECDPAELDAAGAERFGVGALPGTLAEAMGALAADERARGWLGPLMYDAYASIKRAEIDAAAGEELAETCRRYASIY